jgi:DNA-binding NtrC family response regulator
VPSLRSDSRKWLRLNKSDILPYKVLIIDDQMGPSGFGQAAKIRLEMAEFQVDHTRSWQEARTRLNEVDYDIVLIDLNLQAPEDGLQALDDLRKEGHHQPVVLATGNESYLDRPIRDYSQALASGAVIFFNKLGSGDIVAIVREASNRVDSLRRALSLMRGAFGDLEFEVDDQTMTIDQILRSPKAHELLSRALRESLNALLLDLTRAKLPKGRG